MQRIPVVRLGEKDPEIIIIDSNQVLKIDKIREREYIIHTQDEQYLLDVSFESIEEWLFEDGFRLIDSINIVNMNHVQHYDERKGTVYLGDPNHKQTKKASVARIQKEHIKNVTALLKLAEEETATEINSSEALIQAISQRESNELFLRSYATIQAITERKKAEAQIIHMAYHDTLTRLPNRQLFSNDLTRFFSQSNGDIQGAVIFLDLDRFKIINDTLGHFVGDLLLNFIGQKLQSYMRDGDTIARFGGDEFIILLTNITNVDDVTTFVKGIPTLLSQAFTYENQELYVTASIGVSLYPNHGTDADTLIKNADIAMYRAKDKGGNTYEFYQSSFNYRSMERLSMEISLRRALERDEIKVYYQPLLDLSSGLIFGMECLARWKHPEWGMIAPSEFIPLAEEIGTILPIGNYVLQQACRQVKIWEKKGYPSLSVSVNISYYQFQQAGFVNFIAETLEREKLQPHRLCLEITENVAMKNLNLMMNTMTQLKELGVQIAIDDFGTGYSSLGYLKNFKVNTLKIDQSFIKDVTTDEDNAAIVTALIAMCRQLKIKSLAEGVETQEQLDYLKSKGCDEIQGYLYSKPIPQDEFEMVLRENRNLYNV